MKNTRIKSVFKIVCYATLVVILCYIEGKFDIIQKFSGKSVMSGPKILSAEFEVFGIVQGVFFRKNTEDTAKKLGVRGWCMNTRDGTVKGVIEGEQKNFAEMRHWLTNTGSSQSRIDKAVFSEPKELTEFSLPTFEIRRVPRN